MQKYPVLGTVILGSAALFLAYMFVVWTVVPFLQMVRFYILLPDAVAQDSKILTEAQFPFSPNTFVQPGLRSSFLDFLFQKYGDGTLTRMTPLLPLAIEKMEEIVHEHPNNAPYFLNLGKAYDLSADLMPEGSKTFRVKAEANYQRALLLVPENQRIIYAYAINLVNQGKNNEAIAMLRGAIEKNETIPETHYYLGLVFAATNLKKNADAIVSEMEYAFNRGVIRNRPLAQDIYQKLIGEYSVKNDRAHFEVVVKRLIILDPQQKKVYQSILDALESTGKIPSIKLQQNNLMKLEAYRATMSTYFL